MNAVEMVKEICKQRDIPISRLERECGFSNGYIGKLKRGYFPIDKAQKIAERLDLDVNTLIGVQTSAQRTDYYQDIFSAVLAREMFNDPEIRALFHVKRSIPPERFQAYYNMIKELYRLENPTDGYDFDSGEPSDGDAEV